MDTQISTVKIHPSIGIARVGNSTSDAFIGPELPDQPPERPGFYRGADSAIRRQAARFRVFGYNAAGEVVGELKPGVDGVSEIEWTVHLANKKSAWYQFYVPLDVPDGRLLQPEQYGRRNATVHDMEREQLVNDPGPRTVQASAPRTEKFDTGAIMGEQVYLGEISTGSDGRLVVLGGKGLAKSWAGEPVSNTANNDTWYDDISDGPVTATVTINGNPVTAAPAWVLVGPPHYAPNVKTIRTVYDLLNDVFISNGWLPRPDKVSYALHVEPILARFCGLQWVNHGFATQYGWNGPNAFTEPKIRARLNDPSRRNRELRVQVFKALRDYDRDGRSPEPWPWIYGDGMAVPPKSDLQHMVLSPTQVWTLERWAEGDFIPNQLPVPWPDIDQAPLQDRPGLLDRAALENLAADAFHPGVEVTWPIRHDTMYSEPFRILHREPGESERDYGSHLTPDIALSARGPLYAQGPGDLTRWMAAPWQTDTASCRSGYELANNLGPRYSPYLPTFWPAQAPNQVLTEADFAIVNKEPVAASTPDDQSDADTYRADAFERRAVWLRGLLGKREEQLNQIIGDWWKLGIVEQRPYTVGDGKFPALLQVESSPVPPLDQAPPTNNLVNVHVPQVGNPQLTVSAAADATSQAVELAVAATGYSPEEISAGYIEKIDPFHEWQ